MERRKKILISAYACRPNEGSEPGVGWNNIRELVKYHDLWVLTRENNRPHIEAELEKNPLDGLTLLYCDPITGFKKSRISPNIVQIHYYLWQIRAYLVAYRVHQEIGFDLAHHITYVRYATPSFISLLAIPFIWGPVGGGESSPISFWWDFSLRGKIYELSRDLARSVGEIDPFCRQTARKSIIARATTLETESRLRLLGAQKVEVVSQLGLSEDEINQLTSVSLEQVHSSPLRLISIGRLLHWKGFHLAIRAFAQANLPEDVQYRIIGDGPERSYLERLTEQLGLKKRIHFCNKLPRGETLENLQNCQILIHPSLHESGGLVCLEAMATGLSIICLDLGGPALQVTEATGFKIAALNPQQTVADLAAAIKTLANDPQLRYKMGQAGRQRAIQQFSWQTKGEQLAQLYDRIIQDNTN